ncbi:hypothetical protein ACIBCH_34990 [Amycolatopsis thailandensis]|uniref:hypothetical protein n=1 Tax=Amycolatopsis thailandensis TaxID=589330 RepID=UPI00379CF91D
MSRIPGSAAEFREARLRGLGAVWLAHAASSNGRGGVAAMNVFCSAFGIPPQVARVLDLWHEFNIGPHAISDDELEQLLEPWLSPARKEHWSLINGAELEPDWSGTLVEVLRREREAGLNATDLAATVQRWLGEDFTVVRFRAAFFHAFEISIPVLQKASRWHPWHDGSDSLSDADLNALFAPWIGPGRGPR